MSLLRIVKPRNLAAIILILIFSFVTYAFAAANVVPESGAGDGSGDVSGYTISNIEYTLLSSNPTKIEYIEMDVAATAGAGDASDVRITIDGGTSWVTCTGPVGSTWTCTFTVGSEPSVSSTSSLQVVAVD